jgi:AraC-like DNA-binding protein
MNIVALLPSELLAQLIDAVGDAHSLHAATDPVELNQLTASVDADLVIIDPTICVGRFADAIIEIVFGLQDVPVVVYTIVSALAMALVLRLAPVGVRHLVLYGIDDEPHAFLALIERVPAYPIIDLMLRELNDALSTLPSRVNRAVELLFKSPSRARTGAELAQMAGMTRRSLYRHMATAGLQPRDLIDCARLLRAYTLLRAPGSRLKETSAKLGFARSQTLSDLLREWTGQTTRGIPRGMKPDAFVRLLADRVLHVDDSEALVGSLDAPEPTA